MSARGGNLLTGQREPSSRLCMRFMRLVRAPGRAVLPALAAIAALSFTTLASADDVAIVEQKLQALEAPPQAPTTTPAAEPIARAREALGRARAFRNAGDELHAKLAIALAQDWTLAAEDIARAASMERDAAAASKDADDARKRITREEAQLEEQLVRGARLRASVEAREKEVVGRARVEAEPKTKAGAPKKPASAGKPAKGTAKKPTEIKGEAP